MMWKGQAWEQAPKTQERSISCSRRASSETRSRKGVGRLIPWRL